MLIDWFTVAAQIVNFLVLVLLLKRFLWSRLVAAIDKREQRVAGQLAEADAKRQEADRQMGELRALREDFDRKSAAMLVQAKLEAEQQRNAMLEQAREEVRGLEAKWHQDLERGQAAFLDEVRHRAAGEMLAVIRRALADLACADVQRSAIQVFLEKFDALDAPALRDFAAHDLTVLTAGEMPEESRRELRARLEKRLGPGLHLKFERAPAMAWGIELRGNGRRIGWNSDAYVEALEQNLKEALEHRAEVLVA
jgi:F-type H+-transporting ATPase subunit b